MTRLGLEVYAQTADYGTRTLDDGTLPSWSDRQRLPDTRSRDAVWPDRDRV